MLEINDLANNYLIVSKNGQVGVIKNGKSLINYAYQEITYDSYNNIFILTRNTKVGMANTNGKECIPVEYKEINIKGIYLQAVAFDETISYFDAKGNIIEGNPYDTVLKTDNDNYFITIDGDGRYGLMDTKRQIVLENKYEYLENLQDDYFIASNEDGALGIINHLGEIKVEFQYDVLQKIENTNVLEAKILKTEQTDLYTSKLERIYTGKEVTTYPYDTYIQVTSNEAVSYFDLQGNKLEKQPQETGDHPENIGEYHRVYYGYGESYYTKETEE